MLRDTADLLSNLNLKASVKSRGVCFTKDILSFQNSVYLDFHSVTWCDYGGVGSKYVCSSSSMLVESLLCFRHHMGAKVWTQVANLTYAAHALPGKPFYQPHEMILSKSKFVFVCSLYSGSWWIKTNTFFVCELVLIIVCFYQKSHCCRHRTSEQTCPHS